MLELIPLRNGAPEGRSDSVEVLIQIAPPALQQTLERPALNLGLVLDRSGSMQGQKLNQTLEAARRVVESLLPTDRLSVVTFDDRVHTLIPSTLVTDKPTLLRLLSSVVSGGSTALHAGWLEGATEVARCVSPGALNRVLLLTDGQANVGLQAADPICNDVHGLSSRGVSTSTLGFGDAYNENLLRAMAASGDGNHSFVESPEQLNAIFEVELGGLLATVGNQLRLTLESEAEIEVLTRLEKDASNRLRLNDLVVGNPLSVLLRLHIPAQAKSPRLSARLGYYDLTEQCQASQEKTLLFPLVSEADWKTLEASPRVLQEIVLHDVAAARDEATRELERSDTPAAERILQEGLARLEQLPTNSLVARHRAELGELLADVKDNRLAVAKKRAVQQERQYNYSSISLHNMPPEVREQIRRAKEQQAP